MGSLQTPLLVAPSIWIWVGFVMVVVGVVLAAPRRAMLAVAAYVGVAAFFALGLLVFATRAAALTFVTGYVLEASLSIDNIFVIVVIFDAFAVPRAYEQRVLLYGVLGALIMRGGFIAAGLALVGRFGWIMYGFGALLVYAAIRTAFVKRERVDPEHNPVVSFVRRFIPLTPNYDGEHFVVWRNARRLATPLLLVLVLVEFTDLLFATDSIPAIFGITRDPFLVFTSNILAVLGLRSLYVVLRSVIDRLSLIRYGLAMILAFVGLKMLGQSYVHIGTGTSLAVILTILVGTVVASVAHSR